MRGLPFKALLMLVVFPPVMYMFGLQAAEAVLFGRYQEILARHVPGDTQPLLNGRADLADTLQENITRVYTQDPLLSRGVRLTVVVKTSKGRRIYPPVYQEPGDGLPQRDPIEVASRNYALLNEGLLVDIDVKINQNTVVANALLATCILLALAPMALLYRKQARKLTDEETERTLEMQRWREREETQQAALFSLRRDNAALMTQIARIQSDMERERSVANRNEEDLFAEMADLEQQLQFYLEAQKKQENLIADLENQLEDRHLSGPRGSAKMSRTTAVWHKRFTSLYKETAILDRALKGFTRLPEGLQIKAEEIIQQLNADPDAVAVKRKLFQRKGRGTVLEVVFARKGRLYFRRNKNRQVEVLAIGTKNDQLKDLEFLDRIGTDSA